MIYDEEIFLKFVFARGKFSKESEEYQFFILYTKLDMNKLHKTAMYIVYERPLIVLLLFMLNTLTSDG